jgi:hypothetical protein
VAHHVVADTVRPVTSDRANADHAGTSATNKALIEAFRFLGLRSDCSRREARTAFRRMLSMHHPDLHEGDAQEGERTRRVIAAFRLIETDFDAREVASLSPNTEEVRVEDSVTNASVMNASVRKIDADTLSLVATAEEAYARLVEVGHLIGDITYIDRQNGLFETLLTTVHGDAVSLVCTLQGRADETTEAFFTMEPLGIASGELPDISGITDLFAHHLIATE